MLNLIAAASSLVVMMLEVWRGNYGSAAVMASLVAVNVAVAAQLRSRS